MVYKITDDCINCGVCKAECIANAVFAPKENWRNIYDKNFLYSKTPDYRDSYYSDKFFYIAPSRCTGCSERSSEPLCVIACPLGCIVADDTPENGPGTLEDKLIFNDFLPGLGINNILRGKFSGKEI